MNKNELDDQSTEPRDDEQPDLVDEWFSDDNARPQTGILFDDEDEESDDGDLDFEPEYDL